MYDATTSATALSSPGGLGIAASSVKSSSTSGIAPSLEGARRCEDGRAALERARARRTDELAKERRGTRGARLELRMELRGDEPRVIRELDDLDKPALLEGPRPRQTRLDERRP